VLTITIHHIELVAEEENPSNKTPDEWYEVQFTVYQDSELMQRSVDLKGVIICEDAGLGDDIRIYYPKSSLREKCIKVKLGWIPRYLSKPVGNYRIGQKGHAEIVDFPLILEVEP